jgi:hypothetical protein
MMPARLRRPAGSGPAAQDHPPHRPAGRWHRARQRTGSAPCIEIKHRELVSKMKQIRIRRQTRRPEPWWSWIDTRTPSGRVLPY